MADDLDVEAMLEAPYKKEDDGAKEESSSSKEKDRDRRKRSRSRERKRSRSRDRDRDRKERRRSRSRDRSRRSRSRDRRRSRDRDRPRRRSNSRDRHRRSRSKDRGGRDSGRDRSRRSRERSRERRRRRGRSISVSPLREPEPVLTPEERDARTVFCMQLSARIRPRDMEEFFSSVGKVRDVRLITDNKTRRSKGISYVEFAETSSVPLALGLNGQKLLGVPIIVQPSQAEKNRLAASAMEAAKNNMGPMRLYVGSLHFNITEEMLKGIFEPFGKIDEIKLIRNHETGRSQGYGFISFTNSEDAKKALEQLNGFELAGRPMKVGHVTERTGDGTGGMLDSDELDRAGIDLGATGRLQLMAKLAEGTGFQIPEVAANTLHMAMAQQAQSAPPIATQCFMLSNMFDPATETSGNWEQEIRVDVIEECNKHGGVLHIYVDKASPQGNVYVKCPTIAAAAASVQALHGRWFAGKVITAAYVPLPNYHSLFPDAIKPPDQLIMAPSLTTSMFGVPPSGMESAVSFQ